MFDGRWRHAVDRTTKPVGTALVRARITADVLTVFGLVMSVVTAVVVGSGTWSPASSCSSRPVSPTSSTDPVAKASGTASVRGAFFDSVADRISDAFLFGGVAWYLVAHHHGDLVLVPFAILAVTALISYSGPRPNCSGCRPRAGSWSGPSGSSCSDSVSSPGPSRPDAFVPALWVFFGLLSATAVGSLRQRVAGGRRPVRVPASASGPGRVPRAWPVARGRVDRGGGRGASSGAARRRRRALRRLGGPSSPRSLAGRGVRVFRRAVRVASGAPGVRPGPARAGAAPVAGTERASEHTASPRHVTDEPRLVRRALGRQATYLIYRGPWARPCNVCPSRRRPRRPSAVSLRPDRRLATASRAMYARHLRRVLGSGLTDAEVRALDPAGLSEYARYWMEGARLPAVDPDVIAARLSVESGLRASGEQAWSAGNGVIMALPHIGTLGMGRRLARTCRAIR